MRCIEIIVSIAICLVGVGCLGSLTGTVSQSPPTNLAEAVQSRLPSLKPGMTEKQVDRVLSDLPLGEGTIGAVTGSGGKVVSYPLTPTQHLRLTFSPHVSTRLPGKLSEAVILETVLQPTPGDSKPSTP